MFLLTRNTCLTITIGQYWSLWSLRNDIWCQNGRKTPCFATCCGRPCSPWTCTPCSSAGGHLRPQVWHRNQVTILDRHSMVVVLGLQDAICPIYFCQENLEDKDLPGVLHEVWRGKKTIQSHRANIWTCIDLTLRGIRLNTSGKAPGTTLNMGSFHCFTL